MIQEAKSTYETFIEDHEQKQLLDKEYIELLASDLLLASAKKATKSSNEHHSSTG